MTTINPACSTCQSTVWRVVFNYFEESKIDYLMPTPGTVERPVERDADRKVGEEFDFFCAACGTLAEGDLADALLGGARRVHLGQDGKIDWQSEPGA